MATRPVKRTSKKIDKIKNNILSKTSENLAADAKVDEKAAIAKEAYEEFQRQAEAYRKRQGSSNVANVQTFPPQYPLHGQPYGAYPHYYHGPQPGGIPAPPEVQEENQELLGKLGGMVRLGIDFINAGLAGGLSLMGGISGQPGCGQHPYPPYDDYHDDCRQHSSCSCNSHSEHHHHDCGCHPSVRGCC